MGVITVATKLTKKENELLEKLTKEHGFISKSEMVRSAVRLYLNLLSLESEDRLRFLRLINEIVAPSRMSSQRLVDEIHREEDE